jgi:hypothetical protein
MCIPGASPGVGGFRVSIVFVLEMLSANPTRGFVGLATANPIAGTEPSSQFNILGIAWDTGQVTFRVMHNDGAGAATQIDTGVAIQQGIVYEALCSSDPNSQNLQVKLYQRLAGSRTLVGQSGVIVANIPVAYMGPGMIFNYPVGAGNIQLSLSGQISVWIP